MKEILKEIKLNESAVSMALGVLVVLLIGSLLITFFRNQSSSSILSNDGQNINKTEQDLSNVGSKSYTVNAGDSLWSIAEKEYGTGFEWTEIAEANPGVASSDQIEVGQELVIPDTNKILDEAASTSAVEPETITEPQPQTVEVPQIQLQQENRTEEGHNTQYTVVQGDSLWEIAEANYGDGYRWVDIAQANNLVNPDIIHTGNVLTLPA